MKKIILKFRIAIHEVIISKLEAYFNYVKSLPNSNHTSLQTKRKWVESQLTEMKDILAELKEKYDRS